jgi:hypothetical protein
MKTRFSLLALAVMLAMPILGRADDPSTPRVALSETYDVKGGWTPVVAGELREFDNVLARPGFNLHLKGLVQPIRTFKVGSAITYDLHKHLPLATGFSPILDLSIGPWLNYGTGAGKLSGGLYVGLGLRF